MKVWTKDDEKPMPLFDAVESEARKEEGKHLAAENNAVLLLHAREIARAFAFAGRETNMDEVAARLIEEGYPEGALGNAAGSVFSGKEWQWTGKLIKSSRIRSHSNLLRTWVLKQNEIAR